MKVPGPLGMLRILGWVFLLSFGCNSVNTGTCTPEQRAAVGAQYEAELAAQCPDHSKPLEECAAYPEIQRRYEDARKAWVTCSN